MTTTTGISSGNYTINNEINTSTSQVAQKSNTDFSSAFNEAIREQTTQSMPANMIAPIGGGGPGVMNPMLGISMPSVNAGMESTIFAAVNSGEIADPELVLFMMLMLMQSGDSGGDFSPITGMMMQIFSQLTGEPVGVQSNTLFFSEEVQSNVKDMVQVALDQVDYHERNKDGSFGSGNYTKFGSWYGMDGQPWCAMFVSWAADKVGILNDIVPKHASTLSGVNAYMQRGLYESNNSGYLPREGDAIYFQTNGRVNHVGIVVAYDPVAQRVYTVEGNANNAVRIRHYDINSTRIHGYGRNGGIDFGIIPRNSTPGTGSSVV